MFITNTTEDTINKLQTLKGKTKKNSKIQAIIMMKRIIKVLGMEKILLLKMLIVLLKYIIKCYF